MTVRNDDKKARMVPPFKLVDENGAEYQQTSKAWAVEGSIGSLESLNPSVSKQGFVVFDVPKNRDYKLKVSGGYWSTKDAVIEITITDPEEERRQQAAAAARKAEEARRAEQRQFEEMKEALRSVEWRTWTSKDGNYSTEAKFIEFKNSKVHLEKRDGQRVTLGMSALSPDDQEYIRKKLADWKKLREIEDNERP